MTMEDSPYNSDNLTREQLIANGYALRDLLASGYQAQNDPSGWPDYDDRVFAGINASLALLGHDVDYQRHKDSLEIEDVQHATAGQLSTWFTLMTRGEYWVTGYLKGAISNGELQAITKRLIELIETQGDAFPMDPNDSAE